MFQPNSRAAFPGGIRAQQPKDLMEASPQVIPRSVRWQVRRHRQPAPRQTKRSGRILGSLITESTRRADWA
ncbi:MAG: hypothetical protein MJA27_36255 [Pseudanabaenales cyanobacterium]|nr:hypothetical protein [Pseudanabaenales cyanobacterium]